MYMRKLLHISLVAAALIASLGAQAQTTVTDELTQSLFPTVTGNGYADVTDVKATSPAVYSANLATNYEQCIQLRSKSNSGIVTTTSGGTVKSVTLEWNEANTTERTIDIYGKGTAYTAPSDLYGTDKGDKLGSIKSTDASQTLTIDGSYTQIGIRSNNGACYLTKITIVWEKADPSVLSAPVISGKTPFDGSTQVTLTADEGAAIYYTTDESTPTTASTLYTGPFTLTEETTVNAIAVRDGKTSEVASKDFYVQQFTAATLASLLELDGNLNNVALTANDAKVVYKDGNTLHLREGGQAIMYYQTSLAQYATLNATISGTVKADFLLYNGLPELKDNSFTTPTTLTLTQGTSEDLDATPATIAEVLAMQHKCDLVKIEGVDIVAEGEETSPKYYAVQGENRIQLWKNEDVSREGLGTGRTLYALFNAVYSGNAQLKPVLIEGGQATGIGSVSASEGTKADTYYTVQGVRMQQGATLPAGIYVKNGKKVVVR